MSATEAWMSATETDALHRALLLRAVEESLLRLFAEGKVSGTTHTCIGQEMSAIALAGSLDRQRDIVFSNHRCHGHYLAWTGDVEGLIAEVMGKRTGTCGGIGGSQHLCAPGFFSNGIQGGIVPVAAGLALGAKMRRSGGIVAVCIGDGTLGEGVVYETFNIASKWKLPLLVVLENNLVAQSTSQAETLAGEISARPAAFGIPTFHGDTWEHAALAREMKRAADHVRDTCSPAFVQVDTFRLAAHSKGDDDRDPADIARYAKRDPVNVYVSGEDAAARDELESVRGRVASAIEKAQSEPFLESFAEADERDEDGPAVPVTPEPGTQLEAINAAIGAWLSDDPDVMVIGEDIRSPYGGAFKVTRGMSFAHPDRVLNTPISEAAIVGVGNGLALAGMRPVVEIMFGDFLGLCFDQILNHAAKFRGMYNRQVTNPIVIRTPMGGGRGYGPTHSQNIEKHFAGIPGIRVLVPHVRTRVAQTYRTLRESRGPVLMIENKLLYRERADSPLPGECELLESGAPFPDTVLRPRTAPDLTIVAFGRMSVLAEKAAARLYEEEEISVELVFPLQVSPFRPRVVLESASATRKLLVVEEGAAGFDLGAEVIAAVATASRGAGIRYRRIAAVPVPIPSATTLEQQVLPDVDGIVAACLELFDE
jgi:2-oxoisovalerate dehydrogenase E1 component